MQSNIDHRLARCEQKGDRHRHVESSCPRVNAFGLFCHGRLPQPVIPRARLRPSPPLRTLSGRLRNCVSSSGCAQGQSSTCAVARGTPPRVLSAVPRDSRKARSMTGRVRLGWYVDFQMRLPWFVCRYSVNVQSKEKRARTPCPFFFAILPLIPVFLPPVAACLVRGLCPRRLVLPCPSDCGNLMGCTRIRAKRGIL